MDYKDPDTAIVIFLMIAVSVYFIFGVLDIVSW